MARVAFTFGSALKWTCIVLAVVVGAALLAFQHRLDDEVRRRVVAKIQAHYPGLRVSLRSAELVEGQGIELRGLAIDEPGASGPRSELIYIDEVFLNCATEWRQLLQDRLEVARIVVRRPKLRATRRVNGAWTVTRLWPPPKFSDCAAEIRIEGATVEIFDPTQEPSSSLTLRDIGLTLSPTAGGAGASSVQGQLVGDYLQRLAFQGDFSPKTGRFSLAGVCEGLEISPELGRALPAQFVDPAWFAAVRALARAEFQVSHDPSRAEPWQFAVENGRLSRGRIDHSLLPYPLADLRAEFRADGLGLTVTDLRASHGATSLRLDCQRNGWDRAAPLELKLEGRQVTFDRQLVQSLPEHAAQVWRKFAPAGAANLDALLHFDGAKWTPEFRITCLDVGFTYHAFPYRLEHCRGSIVLRDDALSVDVSTSNEGDSVRVLAEVQQPGANWHGEVQVRGDRVHIDQKLVDALRPQHQQVLRSLNPQGLFNLGVSLRRDQGAGPVDKRLFLGFAGCSVRCERFPYPLANVRGRAEMHNDVWTFQELEGTNDTGLVRCHGELSPSAEGPRLVLNFEGANIPLEEELREALGAGAQRLWDELRPSGAVQVASRFTYWPNERRNSIWTKIEPAPGACGLDPRAIPYRLDIDSGAVTYTDGRVELNALRARHSNVAVAADGTGELGPEGDWRLRLHSLQVDRLRADHDLVQALPDRLRKAVLALGPTGPMWLSGAFGLRGNSRPGAGIATDWDLRLDLYQCDLRCGIDLQRVEGAIQFAGEFDGENFHSRGELNLDSAIYRDFQFTEVRGPLWIDDRQVLLGSRAAPAAEGRPARSVTARLLGGAVATDATIALAAVPSFQMVAQVQNVDLGRFARESLPGVQRLSGEVSGSVELHGKGTGTAHLGGRGAMALRNADIYELPVMVSLLKILSIRPPDATAFTASDVEFRVQGEHVYLDRIKFTGDAVSLLGQGAVGLNRSLQLTFHAVVGRDEFRVPLVSDVLGGASQQILLIHVDGTLDNPQPRREPFPVVNQAIRQLLSNPSPEPRPTTAPPPRTGAGWLRLPWSR